MSNHILVIADGRSPITQNWITMLQALGYQVSLVSTYPLENPLDVTHAFTLPVAFSGAGSTEKKQSVVKNKKNPDSGIKSKIIQTFRPMIMKIRYLLGPLTIPKYQAKLNQIISEIKPDIVHALRIPFEGMLASSIPEKYPLLVSIWGNDLTLHAPATKNMSVWTRKILTRANGLLADVQRDITLAYQWGFDQQKPTLVVPGGGGIRLEKILQSKFSHDWDNVLPSNVPIVVNPRGIRAYARTDVFFQAIPNVLKYLPDAVFLCPAMEGKTEAIHWVERLGIKNHVWLLPSLPQNKLWSLFQKSQISTSITIHDGTPNTLLEAMACGCFPIAGDIDSLREWITPGLNGFLVPPADPNALAEAIVSAYQNSELRKNAADLNKKEIQSRAEAERVRSQIKTFYAQFFRDQSFN